MTRRRRGGAWAAVAVVILGGVLAWRLGADLGLTESRPTRAVRPDAGPGSVELPGTDGSGAAPGAGAALPSPHPDAVETLAPADGGPGDAGETPPAGERMVVVSAVAPDGRPLVEAFTEHPQLLPGEVLGGRAPVAARIVQALGVVATHGPPPAAFPPAILDLPPQQALGAFSRDGRLLPDDEPTGRLGVLSLPDDGAVYVSLVLRQVVLASERVAEDETHARFELDPGELLAHCGALRLRVVAAEDGRPLPHARVFPDLGDLYPAGLRGHEAVAPAADGEFLIAGLPPGARAVLVADEGREHRLLKVVVPEGRGLDLGDVPLAHELVLQGWAVDDAGRPITGRFGALPLPHETAVDMLDVYVALYRGAVTDARGAFTLRNLGHERYLVVVTAVDMQKTTRSGWQVVDLRGEDAPDAVEVRCPPATTVSFAGADERGHAPGFSLVRASDGLRLDVHGRLLDETRHWDIPQGRYTLIVHDRTGRERERPLTVGPDPQVVLLDG